MGYTPGFFLKAANSRPLRIPQKRHNQSRKDLGIVLEGFRRRFREIEEICRTCQNRPCSKPWAVAQAFCSKSANFRPLRIHPKSTKTVAQAGTNHFTMVLEAFHRVPQCSKPWRIPQAFTSKTANFRPLRIPQKSTQTVAQRVRKTFKRLKEAFQRVWSDLQYLPKSAMFKTVRYCPDFFLKNGQFSTLANSP